MTKKGKGGGGSESEKSQVSLSPEKVKAVDRAYTRHITSTSNHSEGSGCLNINLVGYDEEANPRLTIKEQRHRVVYEGPQRDKVRIYLVEADVLVSSHCHFFWRPTVQ